MPQINLRITEEEYQILEQISKIENIPVTSLFRTIINKSFEEWKINKLFELYSEGKIHFKDIVRLSGLSYSATINLFARSNFEPPHSELAELKSEELSAMLAKETIYKNPKKKRIASKKTN